MFFSKGDKAPTVELPWLELEGTVKMCLSYRKFKPSKFCNFSEKKTWFWPVTVSLNDKIY
jgi:hypothetical protein